MRYIMVYIHSIRLINPAMGGGHRWFIDNGL